MTDFQIVSHRETRAPSPDPSGPRNGEGSQLCLPAARVEGREMSVRAATQDDFAFIDGLQKTYNKALGFQYEQAVRTRIDQGNVLIAAPGSHGEPVGYLMGVDRYFKRDDVGIIYQLAVAPGSERKLIGAHLLKAQFEKSAYGCRLYCCWCAQDLAANKFWEAMGFVPLAFRTGGGRRKGFDEHGNFRGRMHIFWQKRIREGDQGVGVNTSGGGGGGTPYWFPSQTGAGSIGEDRLVLPIPPGVHWSDAKPVVLPEGSLAHREEVLRLESEVQVLERERKQRIKQRKNEHAAAQPDASRKSVELGGLRFAPAPAPGGGPGSDGAVGQREAQAAAEREVDAELKAAKRAAKKAKQKFDPAQEAYARELKDRWLEEVQARPALLEDLEGRGKYDVRRALTERDGGAVGGPPQMIDASGMKRLAA